MVKLRFEEDTDEGFIIYNVYEDKRYLGYLAEFGSIGDWRFRPINTGGLTPNLLDQINDALCRLINAST
jgi:hypothetical protein